MEVRIDGTLYVPFVEPAKYNSLLSALEIRFDSDAGKNITIRDYLYTLLKTLWIEEEGFNGKRPFGNSGWTLDFAKPLIEHGYIQGSLDEDGYLDDYDDGELNQYCLNLIRAMCYGVAE
jgi:hypothetical protein